METKLVKAPFDIDLAKKITNGEIEGKIVTRDGGNVRIVCFDAKMEDNIVALIESEEGVEFSTTFNYFGQYYDSEERPYDLFLKIPEYLTFKEGDVLTSCGCPFIFKGYKHDGCSFYAGINAINSLVFPFEEDSKWTSDKSDCTFSTESEKQRLINALKESTDERAKDCLKMLGIENSPKLSNSSNTGKNFELKPFDKVLVRDTKDEKWKPAFFWCKTDFFRTIGFNDWAYCIPYEGNEHLLDTANNPEDHK